MFGSWSIVAKPTYLHNHNFGEFQMKASREIGAWVKGAPPLNRSHSMMLNGYKYHRTLFICAQVCFSLAVISVLREDYGKWDLSTYVVVFVLVIGMVFQAYIHLHEYPKVRQDIEEYILPKFDKWIVLCTIEDLRMAWGRIKDNKHHPFYNCVDFSDFCNSVAIKGSEVVDSGYSRGYRLGNLLDFSKCIMQLEVELIESQKNTSTKDWKKVEQMRNDTIVEMLSFIGVAYSEICVEPRKEL